MFMTLTGELSWQRLRQSVVDFYTKNEKIAFEPPIRALRGNVRTPSIARWKARGQLYIRRNWTSFAISYGWVVISGNLPKSAFFEGGWVTFRADFRGKGASPTNRCWCQSSRVIALSCGVKMSAVHHLCHNPRVWQTDGQNYDSQDHPRICSRGKKMRSVPIRQLLDRRLIASYVPVHSYFYPNCNHLVNEVQWIML